MYRPMAILARCQHPVCDEKLSGAEWSGVESIVLAIFYTQNHCYSGDQLKGQQLEYVVCLRQRPHW